MKSKALNIRLIKLFLSKSIHIVSFDIPYPANYGGVIDVFYKVKSLKESGFDIILHCFEYGREHADQLNSLCAEVNYYKRKIGLLSMISSLPYIVNSRRSEALLRRLEQDDYPIVFEGIHSSYYGLKSSLNKERLYLRNHNVESHYYQHLALAEKHFLKRLFFTWESRKLEKYEKQLMPRINKVFSISNSDHNYFQKRYNNSALISAFHQSDTISVPEGNGTYCFYHGNLSVAENDKACMFLVNDVFSKIDVPLVIAGKGASRELKDVISKLDNVELRENISTNEIIELLKKAHINVLPTFQATGIKLKLLLTLFKGRFVLVNKPMVQETGLETICEVSDSVTEFAEAIKLLMSSDWEAEEQTIMRSKLIKPYTNKHNVKALISEIN